ncbi:MAG TPA: hypothetical protein VGR26_00030 [Acidimicrobiales bacterium]|nr:hypothetical protein [Acidimicrobiales bacterium]
MHRPRRRRLRLTTTAVAVTLAVGACGPAGDDDGQTGADRSTSTTVEATTTAPPETTTTAAPTPEEQVLAAYQGYWAAVNEAFGPPEVRPELPALRQYATGEVLPGIIRRAEEAKADGVVIQIPEGAQYSHQAEVVSMEGDTATVRDCTVDDTVEVSAVNGEVIDDGVSTRLYVSTLVREEGQWKVATLEREMTWDGVGGCALE